MVSPLYFWKRPPSWGSSLTCFAGNVKLTDFERQGKKSKVTPLPLLQSPPPSLNNGRAMDPAGGQPPAHTWTVIANATEIPVYLWDYSSSFGIPSLYNRWSGSLSTPPFVNSRTYQWLKHRQTSKEYHTLLSHQIYFEKFYVTTLRKNTSSRYLLRDCVLIAYENVCRRSNRSHMKIVFRERKWMCGLYWGFHTHIRTESGYRHGANMCSTYFCVMTFCLNIFNFAQTHIFF